VGGGAEAPGQEDEEGQAEPVAIHRDGSRDEMTMTPVQTSASVGTFLHQGLVPTWFVRSPPHLPKCFTWQPTGQTGKLLEAVS
jgi:hypothetical protein